MTKINKNINKKYLINLIKIFNLKYNNNKFNYNNNKFNNIEIYNNKLDYNNIIYKYNNNNIYNNIKFKYIIKTYIKYMLNHKSYDIVKKINILYKDSIILYNNNKIDIILFIYIPIIKNKLNIKYNNNELLISKILNNIINKPLNKLINNKDIIFNIKPIILKYNYIDSDIYSKSLNKYISKNPKFDNIINIDINKNNINSIYNNKYNNILKWIKIKYLINNIKNQKLVNILYNNIISDKILINNSLLFKNIIGYDWKYKGKNYNSESNARAVRFYNSYGRLNRFNIKNINTNLKLNSYSNQLTKSQSFNINKNGKYNINLTLSHF